MTMTPEMLGHLARLAHLELTAEEQAELGGQLERITAYLGQLPRSGAGAEGAEPVGLEGLRPDTPLPSLERGELLTCAPAHDGACYLVPRTVGGGQT